MNNETVAKAAGCPVEDAGAVRERAYAQILKRALIRMTPRQLNNEMREAWKDLQLERQVPDLKAKHQLFKLQ